ncbi:hypothetical protein GXW83_27475 [Streptacidiphilus sp. PB12-B1b]|uniref:hypothetical protein n=1 Tax=Streptacidiphilus sp. PB12-B1b TaxID=2705012 RepID=UPI0015FE7481|nr:hypothetical protein [Streptacidiphilus sp. PB12-B1b]QMU78886.1 hypothetical protein GXW83_27475 [Streptacidiphilus sp. PB12-B1b]
MAFTSVPVQGTFTRSDGSPESGTVSFTLSAAMVNSGVTAPASTTAALDSTGSVHLTLDANDDAGTTPTGTTYRVVKAFEGGTSGRISLLTVPAAAVSTGVTLGAVTAAAGTAAGTSAPSPVVAAGATGQYGTLTFGSGTSPGTGSQVAVTFSEVFARAPAVVLTAQNAATAALGLYVTAVSATGFTVSAATAPTGSQTATTYAVAWAAIGPNGSGQ